MKIGVLTSSRADAGIYLPLLKKIKADKFFSPELIAFGTHLSEAHGYTVTELEKAGFKNIHRIISLLEGDDKFSISSSYANTAMKFAAFWNKHQFDIVLCLGDRFEMNAAVQAGIPFGIKFAHIHGGETTLGAIDNIYRHQITLASSLHFTATKDSAKNVKRITGSSKNIYAVGSLSLDGMEFPAMNEEKSFRQKHLLGDGPFALVTFHPETIQADNNIYYAEQMYRALGKVASSVKLLITMPNADTNGSIYRKRLEELKATNEKVVLVESLGKEGYFKAMEYAAFMIGNTSSGIIEAASFKKYVVNVGERQKGRAQSNNVINCSFSSKAILKAVASVKDRGIYKGKNIYALPGTADKMIQVLKKIYAQKL